MENNAVGGMAAVHDLKAHYNSLRAGLRNDIESFLMTGIKSPDLLCSEYAMEIDCIDHYWEAGGKDDYQLFAKICKAVGAGGVIDIGCAYGHQSEVFLQEGISYHGLNNNWMEFWNRDVPGATYQVGEYPCEIGTDVNSRIAVSRLCLGYTITDYDRISHDFGCLLTWTTADAEKELGKKYDYSVSFPLNECGHCRLFVREGSPYYQAVLGSFKNN